MARPRRARVASVRSRTLPEPPSPAPNVPESARVTRAASVHECPQAAASAHAETRAPPPSRRAGERRGEGTGGGPRRVPQRARPRSASSGDEEAPEGPANPNRGTRELRLISKRPSARRSPGKNPGPQGAFEVSMINVSCNSH